MIGIHGIGLYLPPEVRTNDWWPADVVRGWAAYEPARLTPDPALLATSGAQAVLAAMSQQVRDPFLGAVARHIMPEGMSLLDMEAAAAREAIERAQVDPARIDLVLTNTTVADYLLTNSACALHERLGLRRECFTLHTDIATHSFMLQLTLAESMITAGRARAALIVQSCAPSRLIDPTSSIAAFFGDGATAAIVAPVGDAHGIESTVCFTDGRYPTTLIATVPGKRWYDEGRAQLHVGDPAQTQAVFLQTADCCKQSIDRCLADTGKTATDIDFVAIHQGMPWLRRVVQEYAGLQAARSVETFTDTGYLFSSTIPASLAIADRSGALAAGDRVMLVGGGPGMTYGATQLVWGRS